MVTPLNCVRTIFPADERRNGCQVDVGHDTTTYALCGVPVAGAAGTVTAASDATEWTRTLAFPREFNSVPTVVARIAGNDQDGTRGACCNRSMRRSVQGMALVMLVQLWLLVYAPLQVWAHRPWAAYCVALVVGCTVAQSGRAPRMD